MFNLRIISDSKVNDTFINSRDLIPSTKEIINFKRTNLFILVKVINKEKFEQTYME